MDTKSMMWIFIGLLLVAGGIVSSLREGKDHAARSPRPAVVADRPLPAAQAAPEKNLDTGFTIDPIKGLRRKDENVKYFQ